MQIVYGASDLIFPIQVLTDGECDYKQLNAIAFVRSHYHACHGLADGTVRVGIAASYDDGGEHTELIVVRPIQSELRDVLGY